jgi:Tol biopolymer transport system component
MINDKEMYFSGGIVNKKNKLIYNKRGVSNLKIQKAKRQGTKWVLDSIGTKLLDFINLENYSIGNPALSPDKKRLFFVSCAPYPEARGQSDIYYVDIEGDNYGQVKSVPIVNTNGRESFPFISSKGDLYFSSDGFYNNKLGYGLLDIYKVENINEFIEMYSNETKNRSLDNIELQKKIIHLESPFNSNKDDFAFFLYENNDSSVSATSAFFSSNREHPDSKGSDDIYKVKLVKK